jgi:T5orf172 domain
VFRSFLLLFVAILPWTTRGFLREAHFLTWSLLAIFSRHQTITLCEFWHLYKTHKTNLMFQAVSFLKMAVYCFSNDAMPGIYKIGGGNWEDRLRSANSPDTYKPPYPYKAELVIMIDKGNWQDYESKVHDRLKDCRIKENSQTEFFRCSLERIRREFTTLDGRFVVGGSCDILHIDQFKAKIKEMGNPTAREYSEKVPEGFPTLKDITNGYFHGYTSFHEIIGTESIRNQRY